MGWVADFWGAKNEPSANAPAPQVQNGPAPAAPPAGPVSKQADPANPQAHPGNMNNQAPNPLDAFSSLFKPQVELGPDGKPVAAPPPTDPNAPLLKFDGDKIRDTITKTAFTGGIDPAQAQKALSGDVNAFMEILNGVAQQAVIANTTISQNMVELGGREVNNRVTRGLDSHIRDNQLSQYTPENDVLKHPAVAPLVDGVKLSIARNNPKMSAADVMKLTGEYFNNFISHTSAAQEAKTKAADPKQKQAEDWSTFLDPSAERTRS